MSTVSNSFTAVGVGPVFRGRKGRSFTYDLSGTFEATMVLEKVLSGGGVIPVVTLTEAGSGTIEVEETASYRWRCKLFTSGTAVTSLADVSTDKLFTIQNEDGTEVLTVTRGGLSLNGTAIDATAAEINRNCDLQESKITYTGTALTLTEDDHNRRPVVLNNAAAEVTVTVPDSNGEGKIFEIHIRAANTNNYVITTAASGNVFVGSILGVSTGDTPDLAQPWVPGATDDVITLNGTTTGGQEGDWIRLFEMTGNKWYVEGKITHTGTEATPFSTAV